MTLQTSGAMSMAQIAAELDTAVPQTMSNSATHPFNWLADREGLSCQIPAHFYGKSALKYVSSYSSAVVENDYSFANCALGTIHPGRDLFLAIAVQAPNDHNMTLSGVTVGGVAVSNLVQTFNRNGVTVGVGLCNFTSAASTATIAVHVQETAARCWIGILAGINITAKTDSFVGNAAASSIAGTINLGSNGVLVAIAAQYQTTNALSMTGCNLTFVDGATGSIRVSVAGKNRCATTTNAACGFTGGDANQRAAYAALSYT